MISSVHNALATSHGSSLKNEEEMGELANDQKKKNMNVDLVEPPKVKPSGLWQNKKSRYILIGVITFVSVAIVAAILTVLFTVVFPTHTKPDVTPTPNFETPVDCQVEWSEYSACLPECSTAATQQRTGTVIQAALHGGAACPSVLTETIPCVPDTCNRSLNITGGNLRLQPLPDSLVKGDNPFTLSCWLLLDANTQPGSLIQTFGGSNKWSIQLNSFTKTSLTIVAFGNQFFFGGALNSANPMTFQVDTTKPILFVMRYQPDVIAQVNVNLQVVSVAEPSGALYHGLPAERPVSFYGLAANNGRVQDVRAWNVRLSDNELKTLYGAGKPTPEDVRANNVILQFPLTEGSGNFVQEVVTGDFTQLSSTTTRWDTTNLFA